MTGHPTQPMTQLAPGEQVDRFVIQGVLGVGGMGLVYRATDPKLGREVALKVVSAGTGPGPGAEAVARLLREARAAAQIDHPNVVAVYDVGESRVGPYIAMELVRGRSLRVCVGDPSVTMAERLRWLKGVAAALQAAHERGLVHRDIKPENIIVRDDGSVKVLDFGIVRAAPSALGAEDALGPALTNAGLILGTPQYMAPEQLRGEEVDARADQFAWGVTAYELLSGRSPWGPSPSGAALVAAIVASTPTALEGQVPRAVAEVVERTLAKEPSGRFPSMQEVVAALETTLGWLSSEGVAATAAARRPPRRSGPRVAMVAVAVLGLGAAVWGAWRVAASVYQSRPTAISDLPPPQTNPAALQAYLAGLQAFRDADVHGYRMGMEQALQADPQLAVAHLRLADIAWGVGEPSLARDEYARASRLRSSLSERDQAFLWADEPAIAASPTDLEETRRRWVDVTRRFPGDAEFWVSAAYALESLNDHDGMVQDVRRARELDPAFAEAAFFEGQGAYHAGREMEALPSIERCLAIAPSSASCLVARARIEASRGDCERVARDAEQLVAKAPQDPRGYEFRANLAALQGGPAEAVLLSLRRATERWGPAERELLQLDANVQYALWRGDLAAAEAGAREWLRALKSNDDLKPWARATWALCQALLEQGRAQEAGAAAADFMKTFGLRTAQGIDGDSTPRLIALARRSGAVSAAEADQARDSWLKKWNVELPGPDDRREGIYLAYVAPAETPAEAEAVMARMAEVLPVPGPQGSATFDGPQVVGMAYALAGRTAEALPLLRRGAAVCNPLANPLDTVHTQLALGATLASTGDTVGACASYRGILARWGADSKAVSARAAVLALSRLACPP